MNNDFNKDEAVVAKKESTMAPQKKRAAAPKNKQSGIESSSVKPAAEKKISSQNASGQKRESSQSAARAVRSPKSSAVRPQRGYSHSENTTAKTAKQPTAVQNGGSKMPRENIDGAKRSGERKYTDQSLPKNGQRKRYSENTVPKNGTVRTLEQKNSSKPVSRSEHVRQKPQANTSDVQEEFVQAASFSAVNNSKENAAADEHKSFLSVFSGKRRKPLMIAIPAVTAVIILTAGVIISSAALGIIGSDSSDSFVATDQSNSELSKPQGKYLEGITVQGVELGGKTMEQAKDALAIEESKLIPSINYTLTCHDKIVYLTEDDFDYSFDTVKVLNEAFEYSEYMRDILTKKGKTSLRSNDKKDYQITMTFDDSSIQKACEEVAKKVNVEMQNAHVTGIDTEKSKVSDMFSFEEGVVGYKIDVDDLVNQITTLKKNNNFTADIIGEMEVVEPKTDLEDLLNNLVLISKYTTYSGNTWAGNMNMTVAMQSMNGSVIKPGEVFSFNGKTGNSNLPENGYYSAGVIVNGASADGIGGGICQAATTIYNAAIRAGMTVVEREPHTWPSVYVPVGIDSAIDYGAIDMKFRNDTDHEVYLICYMDGAVLNAFIYGYKPSDFDEILVSTWFTGSTGIGFGASANRNYYKNGKKVKTEDLPDSFYSNGGGSSYAIEEQLSNYVFEKVYNNRQISNIVEKAEEEANTQTTKEVSSDSDKKEDKSTDADSDSDTASDSTATNDAASFESAETQAADALYTEELSGIEEETAAPTVTQELVTEEQQTVTEDDIDQTELAEPLEDDDPTSLE